MMTATGKSVSPDGISTLLSIPKPESPTDFPEIILKVTNLEPKGKSYGFDASDGKMKIKAIFSSRLSSEILSGNIQNLSLIRVLDYTVNEIPSKSEKFLIITKCEVVSPEHEELIRDEVKQEDSEMGMLSKKPKLENEVNSENIKEAKGIFLKPKQEIVAKSAAQIIHEQHGNMAPSARMAMTRRVHPLVSLNPYQGNWTIKVRVTSKGNMRTYKNARGEGCVFNVELTDGDGTQIQATMFNEAAKKFYDRFELGKVYYIVSIQFPLRIGNTHSHHKERHSCHSKTGSQKRNRKIIMAATINDTTNQEYDRSKEVRQFDDSKIGVKGLIDSGITSIPKFFIHSAETLSDLKPKRSSRLPDSESNLIPTIDISGLEDSNRRSSVVDKVGRACREFGFFQVVNHGVPLEVLDRTIGAIKGFHELPTEEKMRWYSREMGTGVSFLSNVDLFHSKAASWRDTLQMTLGPNLPELEEIPGVCRDELVDWNQYAKQLGEVLMELLCEGLGLNAGKLKDLTFLDARTMAAHYYPYCPQPDLTVGIMSHTDPGVLTVLLQDQIGGLQVKHGEDWVDVKPVPGAIVINVGDIMQILSNNEYKSNEHRVLANGCQEPRISIAIFFNPLKRDNLFGPFPELISPEKPAVYREFVYTDYIKRFFTKELDGKSLTNYYKL